MMRTGEKSEKMRYHVSLSRMEEEIKKAVSTVQTDVEDSRFKRSNNNMTIVILLVVTILCLLATCGSLTAFCILNKKKYRRE
jgi:hypothetical protein